MNSMLKIETTKDKIVLAIGIIALLYLVNPTFGLFELIPDNLPIIGNLDEAAASALLFSCLNYFGYNIANIFKRK